MLFDITNAKISQFIIHKIGSQTENIVNKYSENCLTFTDDSPLPSLLKQFFLATFNEPHLYHFNIGEDDSNLVYQSASAIFDNPGTFVDYSKVLADFLYNKSIHPNIKSGEFYMTLFDNVQIFDQTVQCLGLFKSENKETFLTIHPDSDTIGITCEEGINIKKLDKGCLIFNIEGEEGYIVSLVDKVSKNNEAVFWKTDFLNLVIKEDNNYQTQGYLNVCKDFVDRVYSPTSEYQVPRENQIDLQSRTIEYFKNNEVFNEDQFKTEVLEDENIVKAFDEHKEQYEQENTISLDPSFVISNDVVKQENKHFKSVIKLDKNFHIYVHGSQAYMERGFDEQKQCYFYKLFFEKES